MPSHIPPGFHTVTPYLLVHGVPRLIDFLKAAFGATELERFTTDDGAVMHAQVRIGDSIIMMGEAGRGGCEAIPGALYLYLPDADAAHAAALRVGATELMPVADQFYGDRMGGVKDPTGNTWWIATHKEAIPTEELARRAKAHAAQPS